MEQKLNIMAPASGQITVREGSALELKDPVKIRKTGNILSVGKFLEQRNAEGKTGKSLQAVDRETVIVTVDEDAMTIILELDPENVFGTEIIGTLSISTELKQFQINEQKEFTREQLIKLIRFNKRYFNDADKHAALLVAYQSLQLKTAAELKEESDTRGNKAKSLAKTVNSESIPTEFVLKIPIFKGFDEKAFRVEICLDVTDGGARFWFESVELAETIKTNKDDIFAEQLKSCEEFVIIHK